MSDILDFIHARLADDEQTALQAVGKSGRQAGALAQRWQWQDSHHDAVLTDGREPIAARHLYPDEIAHNVVAVSAELWTLERYPTGFASHQLPDHLMSSVEDLHAGVARHIALNDPDATRRRVALVRAMLRHAKQAGELEQLTDNDRGVRAYDGDWIDDAMHRDIAAYWNWHRDYRLEWAPAGGES